MNKSKTFNFPHVKAFMGRRINNIFLIIYLRCVEEKTSVIMVTVYINKKYLVSKKSKWQSNIPKMTPHPFKPMHWFEVPT